MWHLWVACSCCLGQCALCWPCSVCCWPRNDTELSRGETKARAERERLSTREPESKKRGTLSLDCLAKTSCLSLGLFRSLLPSFLAVKQRQWNRAANTANNSEHLLVAAGGQKARVSYLVYPCSSTCFWLPIWARNIYSLNARPCPFCLMRHVCSWLHGLIELALQRPLHPSPHVATKRRTLLALEHWSVFWPVNAWLRVPLML